MIRISALALMLTLMTAVSAGANETPSGITVACHPSGFTGPIDRPDMHWHNTWTVDDIDISAGGFCLRREGLLFPVFTYIDLEHNTGIDNDMPAVIY